MPTGKNIFPGRPSDDANSADEKSSIQSAIDHLKVVNKGTDIQAIKDATEALQQAFYAASEKMYKQAAPQQGQPGAGFLGGSDDVVDADYVTVDFLNHKPKGRRTAAPCWCIFDMR